MLDAEGKGVTAQQNGARILQGFGTIIIQVAYTET